MFTHLKPLTNPNLENPITTMVNHEHAAEVESFMQDLCAIANNPSLSEAEMIRQQSERTQLHIERLPQLAESLNRKKPRKPTP